jgi:hypothetical protein
VQFDYANMVRLAANAEVRLSELENGRYIVGVARGTVTFRVLRTSNADVEISTPSVAVRPLRKGVYRVTVREDGSSEITVRSGEAEVFTPRGSERLRAGRTMLARGTASDPEYQVVSAIAWDDWDRWNESRDRDLDRAGSYYSQYVHSDVYGAEDLYHHGHWVHVPTYGWCWRPRVAIGWAPYRFGRWSWIDWYGWTWISYDPWGWAPYHYGRWFWHNAGWYWWPGALHTRHHWRPALVAFFGWGRYGGARVGIGLGFGHVGWIPLAPHEPFYPWYGRGYYGGYRNRTFVDNSVHVVNNVNITNVYRNARVQNAITAVDGDGFSRGRAGNLLRVSSSDVERASLVRGQVPVAPDRESLRLADREVRVANSGRSAGDDRFFSRRQPTRVDRVPFEEQQRGIEQVARRSGAEPVRGSERAERAERAGTETQRGTPGELSRGLESTRRPAESDSGRGWRRIGEATRASGGDQAGSQGVRGGEPARPDRVESNSWRRFGDPIRSVEPRPGAQVESRNESRIEPRRESNDSGWRRFERGGAEGSSRSEAPRIERSEPRPERTGESRIERRSESRPESPRGESRVERPSESAPERRSDPGSARESAPRSERRQFDENSSRRGESIRISPPIVRERTPDSGRASRPEFRSGGDSGGSRGGTFGRSFGGGGGGGGGGMSRSSGGSSSRGGDGGGGGRGSGSAGSAGGSRGGRGR